METLQIPIKSSILLPERKTYILISVNTVTCQILTRMENTVFCTFKYFNMKTQYEEEARLIVTPNIPN